MNPIIFGVVVSLGFLGFLGWTSWNSQEEEMVDVESYPYLQDSPEGKGQIIIDKLSPEFRVLPVKEMDGSWSDETHSSFSTPLIRPFPFSDNVARDCISCLDSPGVLSFVVPFFGLGISDETVMRSQCIIEEDYRFMDKDLIFIGMMVCVERPAFKELSLVQKCGHPQLPFTYSPRRFNRSDGK
jgi:hypothetical protein